VRVQILARFLCLLLFLPNFHLDIRVACDIFLVMWGNQAQEMVVVVVLRGEVPSLHDCHTKFHALPGLTLGGEKPSLCICHSCDWLEKMFSV